MWTLRQRLLLVAGWVVAAVATGLVSAGAVAVAGGQVNDRPLRPLSVAEVAALPVTFEDDCVLMERLASGGFSSSLCPDGETVDLDPPPQEVATTRPAEKEVEVFATADHRIPFEDRVPPPDEEASDLPPETEPPPRSPTEAEVVTLQGGRASVSAVDGAAILDFASPRPGYVVELFFDRSDALTVTFWNGRHLSSLIATVDDDGRLELDTTESVP